MKKVLTILLVITLVLALAAAGAAGYLWYQNNHIFVDGDAYALDSTSLDLREKDLSYSEFDQIQAQLPGCDILWSVPFQGKKIPSSVSALTVTEISKEEMGILRYFPKLATVDAMGCGDYDALEVLREKWPQLQVVYQVDLGGAALAPDETQAELEAGEYTFEALMENLQYLPQLESLTLRMPELTREQIGELKAAYEDLEIRCTVELLGQEFGTDTTHLDLSGLNSQDAAAVAEKLAMLPGLETVELEGSGLSKEEVRTLMEAAPDALFHYTFDFYGETISTTDEEVHIQNKKIGDEGLPEVRLALDLMENCKRFVLEGCKISNEELAKLREEYRHKTTVVWRVYFGNGGSCLTDREVIKAVYGLKDSNCKDLIYCEGAKFCDFGHNEYLFNCDFVAGMPNLEAIILSGSPIKDLEAFRGLKKLKFLEVAFCGYIKDLSPLAECESLEMLNISATKVDDITPVQELPLTLLSAKNLKLPEEMKQSYKEANPECWTSFQREGDKVQPYGQGWRYDENDKYLPYYEMLRDKDHFYYEGPIMNTTRW